MSKFNGADTTPEIVAAMEEVNAAIDQQVEANAAYDKALRKLKDAAGGSQFVLNGSFYQVRLRKNKDGEGDFAMLVELPCSPKVWLNRPRAIKDVVSGTVAPETTTEPEITVEVEEEETFAATGTNGDFVVD